MTGGAVQLDIESLRAFVAVVTHGGMTAAAEQLGLTQSGVSWRIKRLEERVGRPLLIRDGHALRPSRDGRIVLESGRRLVEDHDHLVDRLTSPDFTGTVRIGSNDEVGAERMARILGRFKRRHPRATVEFQVRQSPGLLAALDQGEFDLVVVQVEETEVLPRDVVLWEDEMRWVAHRDARFEHDPVPIVTFGEGSFYRPVLEPVLSRHGIAYEYTVTASSTASVNAAIEAGLGVGVVNSRRISERMSPWVRADAFEPLPAICQVVRTVPGEAPDISAALVDAIVDEFSDFPE